MRLLIATFVTILLLISCSNFYPIILSTPVKDDIIITDTIIPSDSIDTNGNFLSRDTLLKSLEVYDAGFTKVISFIITEDSSTTMFFDVDSMYKTSAELKQNDEAIPTEKKLSNGKFTIKSDNLRKGDAILYLENPEYSYSDIFTRLYLQKSDSIKYELPSFGTIVRIHQKKIISTNSSTPIDAIGGNYEISVSANDTLKGNFVCDTSINVFLLDEKNYKKFLFDDPTIEFIYNKTSTVDTLNLYIKNSETIFYVVENTLDSTQNFTDSLVQIR